MSPNWDISAGSWRSAARFALSEHTDNTTTQCTSQNAIYVISSGGYDWCFVMMCMRSPWGHDKWQTRMSVHNAKYKKIGPSLCSRCCQWFDISLERGVRSMSKYSEIYNQMLSEMPEKLSKIVKRLDWGKQTAKKGDKDPNVSLLVKQFWRI